MRNTNKIRAGIITAVLVLGLGAAGAGVAIAAPAPAAPAAALGQVPPGNHGAAPVDNATKLQQMDQMMAQMVQKLPANERDAATRMHEKMRPDMAKMMSGDKGAMGQTGSGTGGGQPMMGG